MTETSPTPDSVASPTTWSDMNADQLSSALRDNKISGFQRGDALTRYANLLMGETAGAAPERINMQSIPTAADDPRPDTATAAVSGAGDPYAPARTPADYQIPISRDPSAEESSGDIAMRQALHAAELPAVTANAIAQVFDFNARQFADAEPAQLDAFGKNEGRALQQLWGDGFAAEGTGSGRIVGQCCRSHTACTYTDRASAEPIFLQRSSRGLGSLTDDRKPNQH